MSITKAEYLPTRHSERHGDGFLLVTANRYRMIESNLIYYVFRQKSKKEKYKIRQHYSSGSWFPGSDEVRMYIPWSAVVCCLRPRTIEPSALPVNGPWLRLGGAVEGKVVDGACGNVGNGVLGGERLDTRADGSSTATLKSQKVGSETGNVGSGH